MGYIPKEREKIKGKRGFWADLADYGIKRKYAKIRHFPPPPPMPFSHLLVARAGLDFAHIY